MKLVALCGLHGAGKDTVADALPARKLAFADVLYREVAEAFDFMVPDLKCRSTKEVEQERLRGIHCRDEDEDFLDFLANRGIVSCTDPRSPRQILQWWGDYRRDQDVNYFVRKVQEEVAHAMWAREHAVITDCRFPNEAAMVRQLGGQIWQVVRPGHKPLCNGHASENDGSAFAPDVVIINNGTLDELRATALREWNK